MGTRPVGAILIVLTVLVACSESPDLPRIPEAEGTWTGTLTTHMVTDICGYNAGDGPSASKAYSHSIEMSGARVSLRDQAGRAYEGDAISADGFRVDWRDPISDSINRYGIGVSYSNIRDGAADVEVCYTYSRPAYGCPTCYFGRMKKQPPSQAL